MSAPQEVGATSEATRPAAAAPGVIALGGNPNCGKTTLFNALTGLRHRVGNYAGVTVERREGRLAETGAMVIDLPGCYSLSVRSPDERIARDVLLGGFPPRPEVVLVVVDASNLDRNLYLAGQILDLGLPVILCLNMVDVAARMGIRVDADRLSQRLGIPVVPMVATRGEGIPALRELLAKPPLPVQPPDWLAEGPLRSTLTELAEGLRNVGYASAPLALFHALQLITLSPEARLALLADQPSVLFLVESAEARLRSEGLDPLAAPVEARYDWIRQMLMEVVEHAPPRVTWSERIDRIATHRVGGIILFLALMLLMLQGVFTWSSTPMSWIESAQGALGGWVGGLLPPGDLRSLIVDGVIGGVGGVIIFLPQITFLFLFIGLLEDSGYMARAAFVMDRVMSRVGLHGKSFIPLLSSFACAIPGILSTRTIEDRRDRMVTILVAPLMSCSARLPVYTLLIAGFIPDRRLWMVVSLPALVLVGLYLLGLTTALLVASVLKRTLFKGDAQLFLMELPPYKVPGIRTVLTQTYERASEFVSRAGTVILCISVLLWAAMRYPGSPSMPSHERLEQSIAGIAGKALEPALSTFGMDWKVGIGILGSFAAREVFVGTMAIVYSVEDDDDRQAVSVRQRMRAEVDPRTGQPLFSTASAIGLMVFYVLAMQCVSTLAVMRRETGSWKWPAFAWVYMTGLAWGGATLAFWVARSVGLG